MVTKIVIGICVAVLLSAGVAEARPATSAELDGTSWASTAIRGSKAKPKKVELSFTEGQDVWQEGSDPGTKVPILGAYAGCNFMSATYEVTTGILRWTSPAISTLIGCMPDRDGWIARHLNKGMKAEIKGKWLVLSRGTAVRIWLLQMPAPG